MELTVNQSKKRKQEKAGQNTHRSDERIYINTAMGHIEVQPPNDDSHVYEAIHTDNKPSSEQNHSETNKGVCVRVKRNVVPVSLAVLAILFTANLGFSILLFVSKKTEGVHGKWNTWESWSQCSATCNTGLQTRNRACFSPALTDGGDYCDGDATEYRLCSMTTCSGENGAWNIWGSWSQCSATCNTGLQTRNRSCFFPTSTNRGEYCDGDSKRYRLCSVTACSGVNGAWNIWGSWSQCSATCNTGLQARNRSCFFPTSTNRGDYCDGDSKEYRQCGMTTCSGVNGAWNIWGSWSQCSATCNTGLQTRNRSCFFPTSTNRGDYCDGDSNEYRLCSVTACSGVNGAWNIWGSWSQCSATCNTGLQARNRSCFFPTSTNRGDYCDGHSNEYRQCSVTTCSVNGGWSSWSSWTACSASCMKTRTRNCTNPAPSQQGLMCLGNSEDKNNCDLKTCSMSALSIRLVNGTSSRNGRLEVSLDGTAWGTVCDDGFKTTSAKVVCWMLGYSGSSYFTSNNTGNGSIFLDNVICSGYESTLLDCKHSGWGRHDCSHSEDIGVTCE